MSGEAKWSPTVAGQSALRDLVRKTAALPRVRDDTRFAVRARERVEGDVDLAVTAGEIFSP